MNRGFFRVTLGLPIRLHGVRFQSRLPKCPYDASKLERSDYLTERTLAGGFGKPLFLSAINDTNPFNHPIEPPVNPRPTEMPLKIDLCDPKHMKHYPPGSYIAEVLGRLPPLPPFFDNKRITPWEIAPSLDIWAHNQEFEAIPRQVTYRLIYGCTEIEVDKPELTFLSMVDKASSQVRQLADSKEDVAAMREVHRIKTFLEGHIRKSGHLLFVAPTEAMKLPKSRFYLKKTVLDQRMMGRTFRYAIMRHLAEHRKLIDVFMQESAEAIHAETRVRVAAAVDRLLLQGFGKVAPQIYCANPHEVLHKDEPHCLIVRKRSRDPVGASAMSTLVWNSRSAYLTFRSLKRATTVANLFSYSRRLHQYEREPLVGAERSPPALKQYYVKVAGKQFMKLSIIDGGRVQYRF